MARCGPGLPLSPATFVLCSSAPCGIARCGRDPMMYIYYIYMYGIAQWASACTCACVYMCAARCMDALCFGGCIQPAGCDGALERIILSVALYTHGGCFFIGKWTLQGLRFFFQAMNTHSLFLKCYRIKKNNTRVFRA